MSVSSCGGTLAAPREQPLRAPVAMIHCKACGAGHPTKLVLQAIGWDWEAHARVCPARPLEVALNNLQRFAGRPPAEYIVDQELARVRELILP